MYEELYISITGLLIRLGEVAMAHGTWNMVMDKNRPNVEQTTTNKRGKQRDPS